MSVAASTEVSCIYLYSVVKCAWELNDFFRNVLILLIAQDTVMNLLLKERRLKAELAVLGREKVSGESCE